MTPRSCENCGCHDHDGGPCETCNCDLSENHTWPDGQVRPEQPYRCGAFLVPGNAQCNLLSDHDGQHVFGP